MQRTMGMQRMHGIAFAKNAGNADKSGEWVHDLVRFLYVDYTSNQTVISRVCIK